MKNKEKPKPRKLSLKKETVTVLNSIQLLKVVGGNDPPGTLSSIWGVTTTTCGGG
jgi:hypothetical protein